jgi:DNA-directed RNA polymerase subunit M/transcription elongation factor TFIIS
MIRVRCPGCNSTLDAKDRVAGQTRKCPKCGTPIPIPQSDSSPQPAPKEHVRTVDQTALRHVDVPQRLQPANRYLICDSTKLIAAWKNDGQGWMLKTTAGMINALRNREQIPNRGNFTLVELKLADSDTGHHLCDITSYQLSDWALTNFVKGEHRVLSAITGPGSLNKEQKNLIRQAIRDQLMFDVWKDADRVLEYLGNTDYHSPGTLQ